MHERSSSVVVGLGELLWDDFGASRRPGGAPANVAFHSTQLGQRGMVVSRVGSDAAGAALMAELARAGVELDALQIDPRHATGRVSVDASDPEHPRYEIHEDVAWDHLEWSDELARLASAARAVCFGTLAQRSPVSRRTIQRFVHEAAQSLRVYDVNLRQDYYSREVVERSLELAHVVKLNLDEVAVLAKLLGVPHDPLDAFAAALLARFEPEMVCITRAEHGCALFARAQRVELPGVPLAVVDSVGAGDAFTAGLIHAGLHGWELERSARFASAVAACVVTRPGAMPELRAKFAALTDRFGSNDWR